MLPVTHSVCIYSTNDVSLDCQCEMHVTERLGIVTAQNPERLDKVGYSLDAATEEGWSETLRRLHAHLAPIGFRDEVLHHGEPRQKPLKLGVELAKLLVGRESHILGERWLWRRQGDVQSKQMFDLARPVGQPQFRHPNGDQYIESIEPAQELPQRVPPPLELGIRSIRADQLVLP